MKKLVLFTALLVALSAASALAAGVNISWGNSCWADAGHTNTLTWACNINTYTGVRMTCSFQPAVDKTNFVATGVYMEGVTNDAGTNVPDWWKLGDTSSGDCRQNLITMSIDASVLGGACVDPWQGLGGGGIGLYSWDTNRTHLNLAYAIADFVPIFAADETFCVQFRVSTGKTVGTGACAGCNVPMTWGLNLIEVSYQGELQNEFLMDAIAGGNQCLIWQGGTAPCGSPIPVRNRTWGQIKGLYR